MSLLAEIRDDIRATNLSSCSFRQSVGHNLAAVARAQIRGQVHNLRTSIAGSFHPLCGVTMWQRAEHELRLSQAGTVGRNESNGTAIETDLLPTPFMSGGEG